MPKREKIKNDLIEQLENNGNDGEHIIDLVEDYMSLWDIKNELIADIEEKGVQIRYQNGENQFGYRKNDSVTNLHKTNTQMLKILDHLGLKPSRHEDKGPIIEEM